MAKQTQKYESGGIAFVGCTVVGVGLGLLFDNPGAGAVIGVGAGFLVMSLLRSR